MRGDDEASVGAGIACLCHGGLLSGRSPRSTESRTRRWGAGSSGAARSMPAVAVETRLAMTTGRGNARQAARAGGEIARAACPGESAVKAAMPHQRRGYGRHPARPSNARAHRRAIAVEPCTKTTSSHGARRMTSCAPGGDPDRRSIAHVVRGVHSVHTVHSSRGTAWPPEDRHCTRGVHTVHSVHSSRRLTVMLVAGSLGIGGGCSHRARCSLAHIPSGRA